MFWSRCEMRDWLSEERVHVESCHALFRHRETADNGGESRKNCGNSQVIFANGLETFLLLILIRSLYSQSYFSLLSVPKLHVRHLFGRVRPRTWRFEGFLDQTIIIF